MELFSTEGKFFLNFYSVAVFFFWKFTFVSFILKNFNHYQIKQCLYYNIDTNTIRKPNVFNTVLYVKNTFVKFISKSNDIV